MSAILQAENVSKSYTGHKALDDVSVEIPEGAIYGLLGPNGAGKSTLIRIINRITLPDSGRILFHGHEITADDIFHIGYMPEERGLYKKMRVGDQTIFFARLKGMDRITARVRLIEWFDRLGISDWWDKKIEDLSKGMAQKVQFICTAIHEPELLIFDEPFSGFDPINADILKREILRLRDNGSTIILSTHNMESVEEICDSITLINKSRCILSGSVDEIRRNSGGNIFQITYRDASAPLESILDGKGSLIGEQKGMIGGYTQQKIHIPSDDMIRNVIEALNGNCYLRSFQEIVPSMNDIFINAVNKSNE